MTESELAPAGDRGLDLDRAVTAWLAERRGELARSTRETYWRALSRYRAWLAERGITGDQVNRVTLTQYRDDLVARYAASKVRQHLAAVRSFYDWLVDQGVIEKNPAERVKVAGKRIQVARRRDVLTDSEVLAVLETCERSANELVGCRDRAILSLMAYCALRVVECERANCEDVGQKDGRLILWVWGKGRQEPDQFVVIPPPAEESLRAWLAAHPRPGGPLFVSLSKRTHKRRLSNNYIRRMVAARFKRAGVTGEGKTPHSLRHTAITCAIRRGASPLQVQRMARHADVRTTLSYYHEVDRLERPAEDLVSYESNNSR